MPLFTASVESSLALLDPSLQVVGYLSKYSSMAVEREHPVSLLGYVLSLNFYQGLERLS
jgi:hypothetical protein